MPSSLHIELSMSGTIFGIGCFLCGELYFSPLLGQWTQSWMTSLTTILPIISGTCWNTGTNFKLSNFLAWLCLHFPFYGKSFPAGSVQITPTLDIQNHQDILSNLRCKSFFSISRWLSFSYRCLIYKFNCQLTNLLFANVAKELSNFQLTFIVKLMINIGKLSIVCFVVEMKHLHLFYIP